MLALTVPLLVTAALLWARASEISTTAQSERDGTVYLRSLVRLLAEVTDQQSLDMAGTPGNGAAMRAAIAEVDNVDRSLGGELGAHDRWLNVRQRLGALIELPPAAGSAYQSFLPLADQIIALIGVVGDQSTLILDPDLDTYYLMDVTVIRLPAILVSAGRLSDRGQTKAGAASPEAAVLADQVRRQSAALDDSMRKSFAATSNDSVTTGLVPELDQFNDAVSAVTPPSAEIGGVTSSGTSLLVSRNRLRDTALALEDGALTQLDLLLKVRRDAADRQRWLVVGLLIGMLLVATPMAWLLGRGSLAYPERGRTGHRSSCPGDDDPGPAGSGRRTPPGGSGQGTPGDAVGAPAWASGQGQGALDGFGSQGSSSGQGGQTGSGGGR